MSSFVESLESRTLLSAGGLGAGVVADELQLLGDARSIRADLKKCGSKLSAELRQITADLKGLPNSSQNRALLAKLRMDEHRALYAMKRDANNLVRAGSTGVRRAIADGIAVFFSPGDAAARAK